MVSLGVINGKAIELVKPEYPLGARQSGVHGSVQAQVVIDPRGCVNENEDSIGPSAADTSVSASREKINIYTYDY